MYFFHKLGSEDDVFGSKKDQLKKGGPKDSMVATLKGPTPVSGLADPSAAKLSLSKSLLETLVTTAGLSADQFRKIWAEACN